MVGIGSRESPEGKEPSHRRNQQDSNQTGYRTIKQSNFGMKKSTQALPDKNTDDRKKGDRFSIKSLNLRCTSDPAFAQTYQKKDDQIEIGNYIITGKLGIGSYCTVKKCVHRADKNKSFAMKIVDVNEIRKKLLKRNMGVKSIDRKLEVLIRNELDILHKIENFKRENPQNASNKYVIKMREIIEDNHQGTVIIYFKN
jgi:hypothetical protein